MNNKIHVGIVGIKPADLTRVFKRLFTDEFRQTDRLDFEKIDLVLDIDVGENPSKMVAEAICDLSDHVEEFYYQPSEGQRQSKEEFFQNFKQQTEETYETKSDTEQVVESIDEKTNLGQETLMPNENAELEREMADVSKDVKPEQGTADTGEKAESVVKKHRKRRAPVEGLLPLTKIDELLDQSRNYKEFTDLLAKLLDVPPGKRKEQLDAIIEPFDETNISWKSIYDRMQEKGMMFAITDQQMLSRMMARVFSDKILKVIQYANAAAKEKFTQPYYSSSDAEFGEDDYAGEEPEQEEMARLENAENTEKTGNAENTENIPNAEKLENADENIEIDNFKSSMIFTELSDLSKLSSEDAKKELYDLELKIIDVDKEMPIRERIESALHLMLPKYSTEKIKELTGYLDETFKRRIISFEMLNAEESSFKIKMRVRKAVSVLCKEYYGIDSPVNIIIFLEDLRKVLLTKKELESLLSW